MPHRQLASKGVCDGNRHVEEICKFRSEARKMLLCALDTLHPPQARKTGGMAIAHGDGRAVAHLRIVRVRHCSQTPLLNIYISCKRYISS
jgi:hypothetical protein